MDNKGSHKSNHFELAPETIKDLHKLAQMCGYKNPGKVIDKLVRAKMQEFEGVIKLCEKLDAISHEDLEEDNEEDDDV